MTSRRRGGLGSGLDALIPTASTTEAAVRQLPVASITPNRSQPRTTFDDQALNDLATSISEHGILQPLIVAERNNGGYELIAGERRWRAAQRAGLATVPALVREATPQRLLELAIVENIQRADLNPLEEGRAYQALKEQFTLSDEQIARRVGRTRVVITNARRLLNLTPVAQQALLDGSITAGHGRAILTIDDPDHQNAILTLVRIGEMNVRNTEQLASAIADSQLDDQTRQALLQGEITLSHAQALRRLTPGPAQGAALATIRTHKLTAQETEQLCQFLIAGQPLAVALESVRPSRPATANRTSTLPDTRIDSAEQVAEPMQRSMTPDDRNTAQMFEQAVNTPVHIVRGGGSIKITFVCYNDEQIAALYDMLSGGT